MRTLTYRDVEEAARRLEGVATRTPILTSRTADERAGAHLFFKAENFQRVGAFKFRGAFNAIAQLDEGRRAAGVVAFSSGNHAQAVALAAHMNGIPAAIVMPFDAPPAKLRATEGYGGEIILHDRYQEDRREVAQRIAEERGMTMVPPYDHPDVIAGQGTVAKELFESVGELDVLFVCLGGGGLLAGCALVARALSPHCKVIGVEPALGNDGQQSLRKGEIVTIGVPNTIADGAQTTALGLHTFEIIRRIVDDVVTVTDAELVATMRFFAERMKMVVEPTGCLAAAAALTGKWPIAGKRVGVIVSGGNVDLAFFAKMVG